jgi:tetratricopeptide (TPR) repeat protein
MANILSWLSCGTLHRGSKESDAFSKVRQRSRFFARCRALLKRPGTWMLGIAGTVVTGYFTATFTEMTKPLSRYVSERVCEFSKSSRASDEPRFTILVSPLADDDANESHTRRLFEMFYGERGFHAERLCETLSFDLAKGAETEQTIKRGESLIVKRQADLLIFGSVIVPKASIKIWVINEHGGCELRPKPIVLQSGNLPEAFDHESKMQLIAVTLQEIASACEGQASIDWDLFEKRIQKMGPFIERSTKGLPGERSTEIAASYSDAMMLLYAYDRGEAWYTKASEFILAQVKSLGPDASHYRRYLLLNAYADLLRAKAQKTNIAADRQAAFEVYEKAIAEAESDSQAHRKYAEAYDARGDAHAEMGNFERAIQDYGEALKLKPEDASPLLERGLAYEQTGDHNRALRDFDEALKLNPKNDIAFYYRSIVHAKKGNNDRAIQDLDEAIQLDPSSYEKFLARGNSYYAKGDFDRAIADYDQAIKLNPKNDIAFYYRGIVHAKKGNNDRAIQDLDEAIELDPRSDGKFLWRGYSYDAKGDFDRAMADYDHAINLGSKDAQTFVRRADIYFAKGNYDKAMRDCDHAIGLDPAYAPAFQRRGVLFRFGEQFERAIENFNRALYLNPNFALAIYGRGLTYSNNGQYDLAISDYNSALQLQPDWARALYGRGVAKLKKGDSIGGNADIATATKIQTDVAEDFVRLRGRL